MLYRFNGSPNRYLNGWARFLGLVGVPGAIGRASCRERV